MQINLSYKEFYEKKGASASFNKILSECVSAGKGLKLVLCAGSVQISLENLGLNQNRLIQVGGIWRSNALHNDYVGVGALVILPFVFRICDLLIPYKSMYTFGRDDRSICDFFLRNYFYSAVRREKILFELDTGDSNNSNIKTARDLTLRYLWMIRGSLKEEVFSKSDAAELILANAHAPIFNFSNPVLEKGIRDYRCIVRKYEGSDDDEIMKKDFHSIRHRIMQHFGI